MDLDTLSTSLDQLSLSELQKAKDLINLRVNTTAPFHVSSFVHVQDNFISLELSCDLQEDLWKRIKRSDLKGTPNSIRYLWLSKTQGCYKFSGHEMLTPLPFEENDPLLRVMNLINRSLPWHQWLDSCLLAFYINGEIGVNFHDDDEIDINQDCPIKNVSLSEGEATRNILFKAKSGSNFTGSVDLTLANCSLMTMEPGCQKGFLHSVPPQNINKGRRILLSFRKAADPAIVKLLRQGPPKVAPLSQAKTTGSRRKSLPTVPAELAAAPLHPLRAKDSNPRQGNIPPSYASATKPPVVHGPSSNRFTLILGTSITKSLDLGPHSLNISVSGATIPSLTELIKAHHSNNYEVPDTILINAGTKEIISPKLQRAQDLKAPLTDLLTTVKGLYPSSRILFMSMLPVDTWKKGWSPRVTSLITSKVLGFNRLARYLCKSLSIYHVHLLKDFLNRDQDSVNSTLFRDHIHPNKKGVSFLQQKLQPHLNKSRPRPASTAPPPHAKRVPVSLMTHPLPQTLPLDETPDNLDSRVILTPLSLSNDSEVEINTQPLATSSPPAARTTTTDASKSLVESLLDSFGIGEIVAPISIKMKNS